MNQGVIENFKSTASQMLSKYKSSEKLSLFLGVINPCQKFNMESISKVLTAWNYDVTESVYYA